MLEFVSPTIYSLLKYKQIQILMCGCGWEFLSKCDRLVAADVISRDMAANWSKESRGQAPRDYCKGSNANPGGNTCTY